MKQRAFMWVQSRLGLGHLARAQTLCRALAAGGIEVTLAHGGPPAPVLAMPNGVTQIQLPVASAPDLESSEIRDADGRIVDDAWRAHRIEALKGAIRRCQPDIVVTETFPLGRWLFAFELIPVLDWLHSLPDRPLIVASVRDILARPAKTQKIEAMIALAQTRYDLVLCHSDPAIVQLPDSFPETSVLSEATRYTGYAVNVETRFDAERAGVIVAAGGGAVGARIFDVALGAKRLWRRDNGPWTIVAGPRFDGAALTKLRASAPHDLTIEGAVQDLAARYACASIVVAQAGYNTVSEALAHRTRLTVVPYATAKETEQTMRAQRFAARGLLTVVAEEDLTAEGLVVAMEHALDVQPSTQSIRFNGGAATASILRQAIAARAS